MPAALVLACAGVLALSAYAGVGVLALAVLMLQLAFVGLWVACFKPVDRRGTQVVAGLSALAADVAVLVAGREPPSVGPVAPVLGVLVVAAIVQQLARRGGRADVVASSTGTVALGAAAVLPAAALAAREVRGGASLVTCVVVGAALVAAASTVGASAGLRYASMGGAVLVAVGAGAGLGSLVDEVDSVEGGLLGFAGGLVAVCLSIAAGYAVDTARRAAPTGGRRRRRAKRAPARELAVFGVLAPLVAACPAAYLLGRLVVS